MFKEGHKQATSPLGRVIVPQIMGDGNWRIVIGNQ